MRSSYIKLLGVVLSVMAVAVLGLSVAPARAFDPGDGRYDPGINDHIAVYCRDTGVEVWGLDSNFEGHYLFTFNTEQLASGKTITVDAADGKLTLKQDSAAVVTTIYDEASASNITTVDESAKYTVTWSGGSFGANGAWPFAKIFDCTYLK